MVGIFFRIQSVVIERYGAVEGPRHNRQSVVDQTSWESWFLELLLDSSPLMGRAQQPYGRSSSATAGESSPAASHSRNASAPLTSRLAPWFLLQMLFRGQWVAQQVADTLSPPSPQQQPIWEKSNVTNPRYSLTSK